MHRLIRLILLLLSFAALPVQAACNWDQWRIFAERHIQQDGRVIDYDAESITTSEGQSYAMFFALVAGDRQRFDRMLEWTTNNLAKGALDTHLPGWKWGKAGDGQWKLLDENSASDADLWIAYSLLQADARWHDKRYRKLGQAMLANIAKREVADLPGAGEMLLPGPYGFALNASTWRLNASYAPVQLLRYFAKVDRKGPWNAIIDTQLSMLKHTAPKGIVGDWTQFHSGEGFVIDGEKGRYSSYDAIRVYLWWGMLDAHDPASAAMQPYLSGMAAFDKAPEKVAVESGQAEGQGPSGFAAALLPYRAKLGKPASAIKADAKSGYYNFVLTLFGSGWMEKRFRFTADGRLIPCR